MEQINDFLKKICLSFLCFLSLACGYSQNNFFFNHYSFNKVYLNPASFGVDPSESGYVAFMHRYQWTGYTTSFDGSGGNPSTQLLSLALPFSKDSKLTGLGITLSNDKLGLTNFFEMRLSVGVKKHFDFGTISVGLMPRLISQTVDFSRYRSVEPEPNLPSQSETLSKINMNAGIYFLSRSKFFVGISASNLLKTKFGYRKKNDQRIAFNNILNVNTNLLLGKKVTFSRNWELDVLSLIRTDFVSSSFEISLLGFYRKLLWAGLSYRYTESINLLIGTTFLKNRFSFGYSFDYVTNDREAKRPTSHEILLKMKLEYFMIGKKKNVKTPRFTN